MAAKQSYGFDLLVALILFSLSWLALDSAEFRSEAKGIGLGLGALVGGHYLVRLWRFLVTVPREQDDEHFAQLARIEAAHQRKCEVYTAASNGLLRQLAELQRQLAHKQKNQAFADMLTERYRFGLHTILNMPLGPGPFPEDWGQWKVEERKWTQEVTDLLEVHGCSRQEISHFRELHEVELRGYHDNLVVDQAKSMFSLRLKRLKKIINTYADNPILTDD